MSARCLCSCLLLCVRCFSSDGTAAHPAARALAHAGPQHQCQRLESDRLAGSARVHQQRRRRRAQEVWLGGCCRIVSLKTAGAVGCWQEHAHKSSFVIWRLGNLECKKCCLECNGCSATHIQAMFNGRQRVSLGLRSPHWRIPSLPLDLVVSHHYRRVVSSRKPSFQAQ